jgi:Na+-driven multidrug efflux pump
MNIVGMIYNIQLIKYAGTDGIAAYGVMLYIGMIFSGAFIGYTIGSAPIISYHYGAKNFDELKNVRKKGIYLGNPASFYAPLD